MFSRARANWQRCKQCVEWFQGALDMVHAVQHWQRPFVSLAALPVLVLFAFRPGLVAACVLATTVAYTVSPQPFALL